MDDADRIVARDDAQDRQGDRVVAADGDRQGTGRMDVAEEGFDKADTGGGIERIDGGIADIGDIAQAERRNAAGRMDWRMIRDASRIAAGPWRAPERKFTPMSKGTPAMAISISELIGRRGVRRKVAISAKRGVLAESRAGSGVVFTELFQIPIIEIIFRNIKCTSLIGLSMREIQSSAIRGGRYPGWPAAAPVFRRCH